MPHKRKDLTIEGPNLWYLVGLITSDGCLSSDGRHIDITSSDYEFLQGVKNLIGNNNNKIGTKYGAKRQRAYRIQISNRNFYEFLSSVGLTPNKSLIIGALNIPNEFFKDFLRGVIDGDGGILKWFHPTNFREQWSLRITAGSKKFLEWLEGGIEEVFSVKGKIYQENRKGTQFVIKYGKMAARRILGECYYRSCFGLERKMELARKCIASYQGWSRSKTILN